MYVTFFWFFSFSHTYSSIARIFSCAYRGTLKYTGVYLGFMTFFWLRDFLGTRVGL
jgi:hypothetical protein